MRLDRDNDQTSIKILIRTPTDEDAGQHIARDTDLDNTFKWAASASAGASRGRVSSNLHSALRLYVWQT